MLLLLAACDLLDPATATPVVSADADGDGFVGDDCDDGDASVYPGAFERCDGVRNDCDDPDWTTDDGLAFFEPLGGELEDWTERLAAGGRVDILRSGALSLCTGVYDVQLVYGPDVLEAQIYGPYDVGATLTGDADGPGGLGVVDFTSGGSFYAEWVTLQQGSADLGGGLHVRGEAVLRYAALVDNEAVGTDTLGWGGGAWVDGSLELQEVQVEGNTAEANGGGIAVENGSLVAIGRYAGNAAVFGGAFFLSDVDAELFEVELVDNQASSGAQGYLLGSRTLVGRGAVEGGEADYGGAFFVEGGALQLEDLEVRGNRATQSGGALHVEGGATATIGSSVVRGNTSIRYVGDQPSSFSGYGGAVYLDDSTLNCDASDLGGNTSRWGTAVFADFRFGGPARIDSTGCDWDGDPVLGPESTAEIQVVVDDLASEILYDPGRNASFLCDAVACDVR